MKQGVAKTEGPQDPAHGLGIKLEFLLDVLARNSEIEAIDISKTSGDG
jgi:hypothetical protein